MEYNNILNKELRIAGIHISDMTTDHVKSILGQCDNGVRIDSLIVFFDKENDYLVVNTDDPCHAQLVSFIESYLVSSDQGRCEVKGKFESKTIKDIAKVLDDCISHRTMQEIIRIAAEMDTKEENGLDKFKLLNEIQKHDHENLFQLWKAYNCGYMQGVRNERARRKATGEKHR